MSVNKQTKNLARPPQKHRTGGQCRSIRCDSHSLGVSGSPQRLTKSESKSKKQAKTLIAEAKTQFFSEGRAPLALAEPPGFWDPFRTNIPVRSEGSCPPRVVLTVSPGHATQSESTTGPRHASASLVVPLHSTALAPARRTLGNASDRFPLRLQVPRNRQSPAYEQMRRRACDCE